MPILKTSLNPSRARKVASIHTNEPTSVQITGNQTDQLGKILAIRDRARRTRERPHSTHRDQPRASSHINDNHCVISLKKGLLARSKTLVQEKTLNTVNFHVVTNVPSAPGHSQKRELSPGAADCQVTEYHKLKYVKLASCVTQLSCVQPVNNVLNVVQNLPVGARLQKFWETWSKLGAGPKTVQILKEGYTLPFRTRPNLTRSPTVISCYANPHRNSYLMEALHQLTDKNAVELVHNQTSLGFFNRLFLVPKPNNKWRPILDLSKLNLFLKVEKFKMETPETIRTSLQQGEWVTSVDFKDAYFHIPIQEQSKKYLRFHIQGRTYQFKALPFGLSTAPMEFTVIAKEVKLMATHQGIRIHQYLDGWLVRARSKQSCLRHTQILIRMCQDLGWLVNLEKSELEPKQVFDFVGYQFDLRSGRVRPTPDRWQGLQGKIQALLLLPTCPIRQFMSLIGLLTATEKQVHLGRLHMRPIQWHLKNHWRVPESLEKIIPLPRSLHPHLQWWLEENNVLQGQPLHPIKHALQIFTDASKEGWGAHLNELTARGSWSVPESKLHINYLELKAVFLALKEFQGLCVNQIVLVATDNTTVVAYINKEGGTSQELVFVSFKKGFDKDISPATISSWIKQTVILCYELSDHQAHTLHQVKAHDVRAFAASKAFQSGVSLEQILSACHWKSHNTFTQFYVKDVAWADSELYHLGPVVAAQQIHQIKQIKIPGHASSGRFNSMGLNSALSSPTSEQVCLKKGGGGGTVVSDGSTPLDRMMIFDHSLRVTDLRFCPDLEEMSNFHYEFNFLVPSNLPANQAVVIQLWSIG